MSFKLQQDVILKPLTNYQIGGMAKYFCQPANNEELIQALEFVSSKSLPHFVLGSGTNILVSDQEFNGLIIKMENKKFSVEGARIIAEAGVLMNDLLNAAAQNSLAGLEWAGGLPGTVGGAIRGNVGCFGSEIKDRIIKVTSVNQNGKIIERDNAACQFNYRDSIFKNNQEIILSIELQLEKGDPKEILKIKDEKIRYRQKRHPLDFPNVGSIFKNCPLELVPEDIQKIFSEKIKNDPFPLIPTAVFLAEEGLKGKQIGGAKVSEKHPNFIINFDNAKAEEVVILISLIKDRIKNSFGVLLEEEVQFVGF